MASYATIAEAATYLNDRLNVTAWECSTDDERRRALAMATNIIDRLNYLGAKTDPDQTNQFPRGGDTTIPQDIKNASAEIALALLDGVDPELEYENLLMVSQGYSSLRSTFNRNSAPPHVIAGVPSVLAWRFLQPYLRDPNELAIFRVN